MGGCGELERDYFYMGTNVFDGLTMLMDCGNYKENRATFFDLRNPELWIKSFSATTYNSLEGLTNLDNPKRKKFNSGNPFGEMIISP